MAPRFELFAFRNSDPITGKWVCARYRAERHPIETRDREWAIIGAAELVSNSLAILVSLIVGGCAINTGVVSIGQDTYSVTRQAVGLSSRALFPLQVANISDGASYCAELSKVFEFVAIKETQPPYIFGNFPRSELQFKCGATHERSPREGEPLRQQ